MVRRADFGLISLKQRPGNRQLFAPLEESFKDWMEDFVKIRASDPERAFWRGANGNSVFPLSWTRDAYRFSDQKKEAAWVGLTRSDKNIWVQLCEMTPEDGGPHQCRAILSAPLDNREACLGMMCKTCHPF